MVATVAGLAALLFLACRRVSAAAVLFASHHLAPWWTVDLHFPLSCANCSHVHPQQPDVIPLGWMIDGPRRIDGRTTPIYYSFVTTTSSIDYRKKWPIMRLKLS
jgi:hypothetical protein